MFSHRKETNVCGYKYIKYYDTTPSTIRIAHTIYLFIFVHLLHQGVWSGLVVYPSKDTTGYLEGNLY